MSDILTLSIIEERGRIKKEIIILYNNEIIVLISDYIVASLWQPQNLATKILASPLGYLIV